MVSIATIGSHSALEICEGASKEDIKSIVLCKTGREGTYLRHMKRTSEFGDMGIIDRCVVLESFKEIAGRKVQNMLLEENAVIIPNRSLCVYVGYEEIEHMRCRVFGNRKLLRAEERSESRGQYYLMEKAGIPHPKIFEEDEINGPVMVKVNESGRAYERAFFMAGSKEDYLKKKDEMIRKGVVKEEAMSGAKIEELLVGPQFNFNFFKSEITGDLELLGVDFRRQTTIDGLVRLPADIQMEVLKKRRTTAIETGHVQCTVRESLLEQVYEIAERLCDVCKREYPPGIIGPFALQGAFVEERKKEVFKVFDISFRIPGSPGTRYTPYSSYLFGREISFGRRIAMELKAAEQEGKLDRVAE